MSADLHMTCLVWDGHTGKGRARHDGVDVTLSLPPEIGVSNMRELYFAPGVRVFDVRESASARRDMTAEEITSAHSLLNRIASAARAAIGGAHGG